MKTPGRVSVWVAVAVLSVGCAWGSSQRSYLALSENDLVRLIKQGASSQALLELVQKYGINFQPDGPTLDRLRKQGAPEELVDSIRQIQSASQQDDPASPLREEANKVLEGIQHMRLGQLKTHDKDYQGALGEFAQAEKAIPKWDEVYYVRGLVLADLHRYAEAAAEWKQYLHAAGPKADPKVVQAEIAKWEKQAQQAEGQQHLLAEGQQHLKNFDADGAIAPLQEAVKAQPSFDNLLLLARAYWIKRDYDHLSQVSAQALATNPDSTPAILYQGAAELGENRTDAAVSTIQRALAKEPNAAFGHELLCDAFRVKHDMPAAAAECNAALRIDPGSGFAHNRLGWILWYQRDFAGALAELRKATHTEPQNADWQADLAYGLIYQSDVRDAATAATEALRLNPKSPFAHDAMGLVLDAQGNFEKAVQEFNEAIRLAPTGHPEFLEHLNKTMRKRQPGR